MTLKELIAAFRVRAGDNVAPYQFSDEEITVFLNQADAEAAERALLIHDETTDAVCDVTLAADTATLSLHASILKIERATLSDGVTKLEVKSREQLDREWPDWETATGTPQYLIENGDGTATVVPIPTEADTASLVVKRLPLTEMAAEADTPEIPVRWHYKMLDWALHLAYSMPDADTFDKQKADKHESAFERSFGERIDANAQRKKRDQKPHIIKSSW